MYTVSTQEFDSNSFIEIQYEEDEQTDAAVDIDGDVMEIKLYYSTTDVQVSKVIDLIDGATFVGSIGGNLGLFLGFSFLGSFYVIAQLLSNWRAQKKPLRNSVA